MKVTTRNGIDTEQPREVDPVLTPDQQKVFDLAENSDKCIFLNGQPGTGKSVVIRALRSTGQKHYIVGAPTGLAATNAGGRTLHSIFRIPVSDGIIHPTYNKFPIEERTVNFIRHGIKALIIDEISMVRADILDYIDRCLCFIKGSGEPFGGIQVIAVGDFYQLPPVTNKTDKKALRDAGFTSCFAFGAKCWGAFEQVELTEVLRQKGDDTFIKLLRAARIGKINSAGLAILNKQVKPNPTDLRPQLTAINRQADEINALELDKLDGEAVEYSADAIGEWPNGGFPADTVLRLKVGAHVIVKMNSADRPPKHKGEWNSKVVNGTLAIVTALRDEPLLGPCIDLETSEGNAVTIYRKTWERKVKELVGDTWTERVVATFAQMPVALAWCITMHKSQGQTFAAVHVNASRVFAPGQLYVAMSRCKTLDGVSIQAPLEARAFFPDPEVVQYFNARQLNKLFSTI